MRIVFVSPAAAAGGGGAAAVNALVDAGIAAVNCNMLTFEE